MQGLKNALRLIPHIKNAAKCPVLSLSIRQTLLLPLLALPNFFKLSWPKNFFCHFKMRILIFDFIYLCVNEYLLCEKNDQSLAYCSHKITTVLSQFLMKTFNLKWIKKNENRYPEKSNFYIEAKKLLWVGYLKVVLYCPRPKIANTNLRMMLTLIVVFYRWL